MRILIVNCVYDPEPVVSAQIGKSIADYRIKLETSCGFRSPHKVPNFGLSFKICGTTHSAAIPRIIFL